MSIGYKWCTKCGEQVLMNEVFECPVCLGSSFTHKKEALEEQLETSLSIVSSPKPSTSTKAKNSQGVDKPVSSMQSDDLAQLIQLQKESIKASNRTTHAVRAFVLFIFYQLAASTVAAFVYGIGLGVASSTDQCQYEGNCEINAFFIFASAGIFIGGVIISSVKGWEEIAKSEL